jgi:ribosomal protein L11 methyltransferase
MYIWRKRARPGWLRHRSEELSRQFGPALALTEQPGKALAILEVCAPTRKAACDLVRQFGGTVEKLRADWLERYSGQSQRKPLRIGSRLLIVAKPDKKPRNVSAQTIIIPAETAFGTGEHATTAMCLRLLEGNTRKRPPGWSLLDAGTGSGILAIAGRCLGAAHVVALDNDPVACDVAKRNARANDIRDIEFRTSDVLNLKLSRKFDFITANLFSELLISALPGLFRSLRRGGFIILSGILRSQESAVVSALRRNGCALQETRRRGKWVALLAEQRTAQRAVPT